MTAVFAGGVPAGPGFAVRTVASPCFSQTSPVAPTSMWRSASTSLTPFLSTMKPTSEAPGFSRTYAKAPYASRPVKGCPAGHWVPSPSARSPQA